MSVTETKKEKNTEDEEIEIRLKDIVQFLKTSRKTVIICCLTFLLIGALYSYSKPDLYSAQVTVLPEIQAKVGGLGGLGSLAGLAGIDIANVPNGNTDAIRPDIYPDVLQSTPFALQLLQKPVYSQLLGKEASLQIFIEEQSKQSWLGGLISSDDSNNKEGVLPDPKNRSRALQITKKQEDLIKRVHNAVSATYDKKTGVITVAATFSDRVVAASVARLSLEYLTNYMISYRTGKARNQVHFLTRQVDDAKNRYQRAEYALSNYRDQNRSLYLNTAKIEEQRLQADFILTQSVFNDLSKQLEQAKIKVSEESPVFKILEPARIPLKKSAPKRSLIIVGFAIAGIFLGLFIQVVRLFILNSKM
ncbi:Wzz/FepE/Etk N-terminal domain-containing protein [Spirosoma radiotolerans]|uniref:Lipopolysaccharide biosynthesis protein n=1 Tax=Spirosoma radiotolerans TaxID=1379870 RepID=A0A0E3ZT40_9BACT|nr:Wzz/FepE/Etk N-terminal domain-containing protein [Spirosoma radiotolerans]AKD53608.1 lipopolysaccharide biosynthesis protein [Spirosoma radiotolerans]